MTVKICSFPGFSFSPSGLKLFFWHLAEVITMHILYRKVFKDPDATFPPTTPYTQLILRSLSWLVRSSF